MILTRLGPWRARQSSLGARPAFTSKSIPGWRDWAFLPDQVLPFVHKVRELQGLCIDGIFTHMAAADAADLSYTLDQLARFESVLAALRARALLPAHIHAANSATILRVPSSYYNMVRLGIAMYGLSPSADTPCPEGFHPALSFKCLVAQVKELPLGSCVSYGCAFRTERPTRIAVIPVGYADGFRRAPAHWGEVLVRGQRAPIIGRVCMDQTMIDVTDIPGVCQGDEVVLIGSQGDEQITVDQIARRLGTINYEVVAAISARVPAWSRWRDENGALRPRIGLAQKRTLTL